MIIINNSSTLAELLPEIHHTYDPDLPIVADIPVRFRTYLRDILMLAFYFNSRQERHYENHWLEQLRQDQFLMAFSEKRWIDIDVVDVDGTYILIFEE